MDTERIHGGQVKDRKKTSAYLTEANRDKVEALSYTWGCSLSDAINRIVDEYQAERKQ